MEHTIKSFGKIQIDHIDLPSYIQGATNLLKIVRSWATVDLLQNHNEDDQYHIQYLENNQNLEWPDISSWGQDFFRG